MEGDVLVEQVEQAPQAQVVQKTVAIPQTQFIDRLVNVPLVTQRQVRTIQKIQKTLEIPQAKLEDELTDVPVVMQRQTSMIQKVATTAEILQMSFIDSRVPVAQRRQAELNEFRKGLGLKTFTQNVEVHVTPIRAVIIIRATREARCKERRGRRIRETTFVVQKRSWLPREQHGARLREGSRTVQRGAMAQAESQRYTPLDGIAVRRACYSIFQFSK